MFSERSGERVLLEVEALMVLEAAPAAVLFPTLVAGELKASVNALMVFQISDAAERLVAELTLMPDVLVGDLLVRFEVAFAFERFPAPAADVRLHVGVRVLVFLQTAARRTDFAARFAAVDVLQTVHPFVLV